jgi:putative membrane protein
VLPLVRPLVVPVVAFFLFNITLVGIHWPAAVEVMTSIPVAHFLIHSLLMVVAIVMWLPILSPIPEIPRLSAAPRMAYLFAHSLLPTIPASFLTFGSEPLYQVYAEAPRLWGIDAITDQTVAGLIMKLGGGAILWGVITVVWFRWYADEQRWDRIERRLRQPS